MKLWLIEPRDPLIFRDGKPFSAFPGARSKSLPFPLPSTIAGGIRAIAGTDQQTGYFDQSKIPELLKTQVVGPLLIEIDQSNGFQISNWMFPAPSDALFVKDTMSGTTQRYWIQPLALPETITTAHSDELAVIGPTTFVDGKVPSGLPDFWHWDAYQTWLTAPTDGKIDPIRLGHSGPVSESRMHVKIDSETQTADEGALFQTSGLEFRHIPHSSPDDQEIRQLSGLCSLALAIQTDASLRVGPATLGGEQRIVQWHKAANSMPESLQRCPDVIRQSIHRDRACRLLLLTPAIFERGYLPTWIHQIQPEVQITIIGAAVSRYQSVSGWDYKTNVPKPSRRLAPAGSVYFLRLEGSDDAIDRFIDQLWLQNCSDDEQDRRDGFGLAILGSWSGKLQPFAASMTNMS